MAAATTLRPSWHHHHHHHHHHHLLPLPSHCRHSSLSLRRISSQPPSRIRAFRFDLDEMAKKVSSGEAWRETWKSANNGFEQLLYESRIAAKRFDARYSVSTRLQEAFDSASLNVRDLDRRLGVGVRLRSFSVDFARNWPRYRREMNDFFETPLGKVSTTIFLAWFVLSGWLFRILFFSTWVLPLAAPLIIGGMGSNLVIQGTCPSCRREFVGLRSQVIRCTNCGNIVWQSQNSAPGGKGKGKGGPFSASDKDVIDIEIEEK